MRKLIILRHGHNFEEDEPARRIGFRTDIELADRGRKAIIEAAKSLKNNFKIDRIISSNLKRTRESAEIVKKELGFLDKIIIDEGFNEIDYGPDENQLEEEVVERIGRDALENWENNSILPQGWLADVGKIQENWRKLAGKIDENQSFLVVTSAGTAKFARCLCENGNIVVAKSTKINPAHFSLLESEKKAWKINFWNLKQLG